MPRDFVKAVGKKGKAQKADEEEANAKGPSSLGPNSFGQYLSMFREP